MKLEDKMLRYRAEQRISQRELAERCGVTLQTINSIETGQQTPSRVTREKILLVIGKDGIDD